MILAKVATGRYYRGSSAIDRTKLKPGYHSTVNDEANPSIFVVYHDAAAYPEYVLQLSRFWSCLYDQIDFWYSVLPA